MMKLISTFKDILLKLGVMFELFKMGVLNSSPVKAFAYVWGLDWIAKIILSCYITLGLVSIMLGDWLNFMSVLSLAFFTVAALYYSSKYYELLKSLQKVKPVDTFILEGAAQKSEDGNYYITVDEALVDNTSKDK